MSVQLSLEKSELKRKQKDATDAQKRIKVWRVPRRRVSTALCCGLVFFAYLARAATPLLHDTIDAHSYCAPCTVFVVILIVRWSAVVVQDATAELAAVEGEIVKAQEQLVGAKEKVRKVRQAIDAYQASMDSQAGEMKEMQRKMKTLVREVHSW